MRPGIDEALARRILAAMCVGRSVYGRSFDRLRRQGDQEIRRIVRYALQQVDADGAISPDEASFAAELSQVLRYG